MFLWGLWIGIGIAAVFFQLWRNERRSVELWKLMHDQAVKGWKRSDDEWREIIMARQKGVR
jgi:hypothetical protein